MANAIGQTSGGSVARIRDGGVRAVLVGLICVLALVIVTPYSDFFQMGSLIAADHLPIGVLTLFVVLLALNALLRAGCRRWAFHRRELLLVYVMMLCGAGIPSFGLAAHFIPVLPTPYYYATPANKWAETLHEHLRRWPHPRDEDAIRQFYEGAPSAAAIPWRPWLGPLAKWCLFIFTYYFVILCLCTLIRKRWIDEERLTFPLVQLPLEMVSESERHGPGGAFFRNRAMWVGFAIPALLHSLNSVHFYWPAFPYIRLKNIPLEAQITEYPWRAMGGLRLYFYPSVVGLTMLLTSEIGAGFWFFYAFYKLQLVFWHAVGVGSGGLARYSGAAFCQRQEAGAFLAIAGSLVWFARHDLYRRIRDALAGDRPADDAQELLPFRVAFVGLAVGTAAMAAWWAYAGMSFWFAVSTFILFYVIALVLTRNVSAGGILFVQKGWYPIDLYASVLGSRAIRPQNIALFALQEATFMCHLRTFLMPFVMDSLKIGDEAEIRGRRLLPSIGATLLVAVPASFAATLFVVYLLGGAGLHPWMMKNIGTFHINKAMSYITRPTSPDWPGMAFIVAGALLTALTLGAQRRFVWWPVHPLGYTMATGWPMSQMWFSIFLGWLLKAVIMRYGGFRLYRALRPTFLGMVLGEFVICGVWLTVDHFAGVTGHGIFPNET